jgi:hypothetical protein
MPLMKPVAGSDSPRPLKSEFDEFRYDATPRRDARPAPEIGIFEEPTRCLKINLQWWSHISGMIDVLSTTDMWQGDEEEKARAIREIAALLAYNDCEDEMTAEEFKQALYEVGNMWAAQLVSGRYTNINIDEEGNVTDPTTEGENAGVPEDDPATPTIDENAEARAGGAIFLTDKLQKILTDMFTWFATYVAPSTGIIPQMAEDRLVLLYGFGQGSANVFVNYWYTVYMNSSGAVTLLEATLDGLFYCKGVSKQTLAKYIYEVHATAAEVPVLEVFAENITEEMMNAFFLTGTGTPSTAYETYSCTPIDDETVLLNMSGASPVQVTTAGVWKQNHAMRIRSSGTFTDPDFPTIIKDMYWSHNTATGVKTFENAGAFNSSGVPGLTSAEVPFEPTHEYNVIVRKTGSASACIVGRASTGFTAGNITGTITNEITDEGEFSI